MKVIDISRYDTVDFGKLKDIDGVIIRAGSGRKGLDPKFQEHIKGAIGAGLPVGIYFFSYAYTVGMAKDEAKKCLEYIAPYKDWITMPVFFDWEYASMDWAKECGVNPTGDLITKMCKAFLDVVTAAGYRGGVYYNLDYLNSRYIRTDQLPGAWRWFARYTTTPQKDCDLWQYTESGKVEGVSGSCDISKVINKDVLGTMRTGSQLVRQAQSWIGLKKSDLSYTVILETYNNHKPLARGYKVKVGDQWCATFVSACAIAAGLTDIIPLECSCQKMIDLFKQTGCWVEDDSYVPFPGCIIFYDWQDTGSGDDFGWADHVGVVEKCDGKTITVIEGNKGGAVSRRTLAVNGKYIRGFGVPKFRQVQEPAKEPAAEPVKDENAVAAVNILGGIDMPELKTGATGKAVKVWQAIVGTSIDGKFGPQTEKKTKAFQKKSKLAQDGVVGPKTWKAGLESI